MPNESSSTQGSQNVLIIRVDFSDLPGDPQCSFCGSNPIFYTASYVENLANSEISPFYQQRVPTARLA